MLLFQDEPRTGARTIRMALGKALIITFGILLIQAATASNPEISTSLELEIGGVVIHDGDGTVAGTVDSSAGGVSINVDVVGGDPPAGGTWSWTANSGGETADGSESNAESEDGLQIELPGSNDWIEVVVEYTHGGEVCWSASFWFIRYCSKNDETAGEDFALPPQSKGSCEDSYSCSECKEPTSGSGGGSGDEDSYPKGDLKSVDYKVPLPTLPNEPGLDDGGLQLYLFRPVDNAGDPVHLAYIGVPEMRIVASSEDPREGIQFSCLIRQASGRVMQFEIAEGSSMGYPAGQARASLARVELYDGSSFTTDVGQADVLRQYRSAGGYVEYPLEAADFGEILSHTTWQGRTVTFPDSRFEIIRDHLDADTIRQVVSPAGALDVVVTGTRTYEIRRYLPTAVSSGKNANGYHTFTGPAVRTTVVTAPASGDVQVSITTTEGSRAKNAEYSFTEGANYSEWSLLRKTDGVGVIEMNRRSAWSTGSENDITVTRTWTDPSDDTGIYRLETESTSKPWGGRAGDDGKVWESAAAVATGSGASINRSLAYFDNSSDSVRVFGKLKSNTRSDGTTRWYGYDTAGRMDERTGPWLDDADGMVETFSYATHVGGEALQPNDHRPRTTTVTVDDGGVKTISKTFFAAYLSGGEYIEESQVGSTPGAAWDDAANLVTRRTYYASTAAAIKAGRLRRVDHPDGTVTTYDYGAGTGLIVTTEATLDSGGSAIAGFSTRRVTNYDARGLVTTTVDSVYARDTTDSGAGIWKETVGRTTTYSSSHGRRVKLEETDKVTSRTRTLTDWGWTNGLLVSQTDATGVQTTYTYDGRDNLETSTRTAISASGSYEAQAAIVTTISATASSELMRSGDNAHWQNRTTTVTAGSITLTSSTERDDRGRMNSRTDENGYTTTIDTNSTGTLSTTIRPDGGTQIVTRHLDGRHESTTGTGVVASYSSYGVGSGGLLTTTIDTATFGNARTHSSVTNMLGQNTATIVPAYNGATVTVTNHYETGTGLLLRVGSTAADTPDRIMEYNDANVVTRQALSQDDSSITLISDDRVSDILSGYEWDGSDVWNVNYTAVYPSPDSASTKLVSGSRSQVAGLAGTIVARSESEDINNNLSYSETSLDRSTGVSENLGKAASNTASSLTTSYYGRTETVATPGVTGTTDYGYDALGRVIHIQDPRHSGDADTVYLADKTLVDFTRNAKDEKTTYSYYGNGVLGAGRVQTVTLPDDSTVHTTYNAHGLPVATWGSQTYTTHRSYNAYDEMTVLRTWQTDPGGDFGDLGDSEPTTWAYEAATGLLLNKRDADNKGCDYTYDTAGRLATRESARLGSDATNPILTEYGYTGFGELGTVDYSNDPADTRPLDYDYDRLGRLDLVTQTGTIGTPGTNTHNPEYNAGNLLLDKETIAYGNSGLSLVDDHAHDTYLRPQQHKLLDGTDIYHLVDYTYRTADGRLSTVTDNTNTARLFTYNYHSASHHLLGTVVGPAHTVTNTWETNRDILGTRTNQETVGTASYPSSFDYTVNEIGQRTNVGPVLDGGSPISTYSVKWEWNYNDRGELVSADHGDDGMANADDRFYEFDAIGNRDYVRTGVFADSGGTQIDYTADAVNEYTLANGVGSTAHDDDGNATTYPLPVAPTANATLVWDAENRLIKVTRTGVPATTFEYDYMGRRIGKTTDSVTTTFIYEGWNLCAEFTGATLKKTYTWGMDLSGSMQGAGGVGGLLAVNGHDATDATVVTATYYPTFDGNGNVSEYLDGAGTSVAHYEYDAFGNVTSESFAENFASDSFAHKFSTKYHDSETGLYYYGFRYYDPVTGRWPSRDPIGESGGVNLYGFVGNSAIGFIDVSGLSKKPGGSGWKPGPDRSCERKQKRQRNSVDKLISNGNPKSPDCSGESGCTLITVIVKLGDPCGGPIDKKIGHTGIGIGEDFHDFGPGTEGQTPSEPYWDDPYYPSNGWQNLPNPPQTPDDIDLDDVVDAVEKGRLGAGHIVVKAEFCACESLTDSLRSYWDNMYQSQNDGSAPDYSIPGAQCTSTVCQSIFGGGIEGLLSPEKFLFNRLDDIKSSCGASKGEGAHFKIIAP